MELISYDFEVKFLLITPRGKFFFSNTFLPSIGTLGTYPYVLCIRTSQQLVCIYCSSSSGTNYASDESQYSCASWQWGGGHRMLLLLWQQYVRIVASSSTSQWYQLYVSTSNFNSVLSILRASTLEYQLVPIVLQSFSVLWIVHTSQYILVIPY